MTLRTNAHAGLVDHNVDIDLRVLFDITHVLRVHGRVFGHEHVFSARDLCIQPPSVITSSQSMQVKIGSDVEMARRALIFRAHDNRGQDKSGRA